MASFIYGHLFGKCDFPDQDLSGLTAIVTGSNQGLGYEGAKLLAKCSVSRLILAVRTVSKGEDAIRKIKADLPNWTGMAEVWQLDMVSFDSVKAFGERLNTLDRLDIFIANAGVGATSFKTTPAGWEEGLHVNVLSTGLLALKAMPKLTATADLPNNSFKPHLVIVASEVHEWAKFPQQDEPTILAALNDKSKAVDSDLYNMSKLLDVLMTREIAKLPNASKINVNSLNPGLCVSELRRDFPWIVAKILNWVAWPTEKGAKNYLAASYLNTEPGAYISFCKETPPSEYVRSEKGAAVQQKLFGELKEFWQNTDPSVAAVLA